MEERMAGTVHEHKLCMEERKHAQMTGIKDVVFFDNDKVILESTCGNITIKGSELKVKRLLVEKQEVDIAGRIDSVVYTDAVSLGKKGESVIGRLFR